MHFLEPTFFRNSMQIGQKQYVDSSEDVCLFIRSRISIGLKLHMDVSKSAGICVRRFQWFCWKLHIYGFVKSGIWIGQRLHFDFFKLLVDLSKITCEFGERKILILVCCKQSVNVYCCLFVCVLRTQSSTANILTQTF